MGLLIFIAFYIAVALLTAYCIVRLGGSPHDEFTFFVPLFWPVAIPLVLVFMAGLYVVDLGKKQHDAAREKSIEKIKAEKEKI